MNFYLVKAPKIGGGGKGTPGPLGDYTPDLKKLCQRKIITNAFYFSELKLWLITHKTLVDQKTVSFYSTFFKTLLFAILTFIRFQLRFVQKLQ